MKIPPFRDRKSIILALGAESVGIFAVYQNGGIFVSKNYGDLLDNVNFLKYKRAILAHLSKENVKPNIIITDLHPLYNSTIFGKELAKRYGIKHVEAQHHIAHIFSSVGDRLLLQPITYNLPTSFIGIASDGTGYGLDGNIWGGEAFQIENLNIKMENDRSKSKNDLNEKNKIQRIGSLEEQVMIGGDLAVKEPARMLISILSKFLPKNEIYPYIKKYYTKNEFEALYSQLKQGFNCQKTTSTGRVLDSVSILLGFAENERKHKHEATKLLEANSTIPYNDLDLRFTIYDSRIILDTTHLFKYLLKNIRKDKKRLAATAQLYIAKGFYKMIEQKVISHRPLAIHAGGGMTNNKIISQYLEKNGVYLSKKIPKGDEGISFGQIIFYLYINRRGWE